VTNSGRLIWATALVALLTAQATRATERSTVALPPEAGAFFQQLLPASGLADRIDIELRFDHAVYRLRKGEARVEVRLSHPSTCAAPDGPLCVTLVAAAGPGAEALAGEVRTALAGALRRSQEGPAWVPTPDQAADAPRASMPRDGAESWRPIAEALFLVLIGGVLVALWQARGSVLSRDAVLPAGLTALALGLRFAAHAGPADIRPVLESVGLRRAGWVALVDLVYAVFPPGDETIWNVNRVVGALSVPLLYAIVRRRFADPIVALGAAAALAVTPLLVRFSASDTPYILMCAALLGAVVAYDRYVESEAIGAWVLSLALLTAAMQLRPDGLWSVVPAALLTIAGRRVRPSSAAVAAALVFVAVNAPPAAWAITGHVEGQDLGRHFMLWGATMGSPWADQATTPRVLGALVVLGAIAILYGRRWQELLWLAAAAVALPANAPATGDYATIGFDWQSAFAVPVGIPVVGDTVTFHQYANARYHIPAMHLACGLVGAGAAGVIGLLAHLVRRAVPSARLLAIVLVCAAALPRIDILHRMWTPQREFEFFREGLTRIDPACRIATLFDVRDSGFVPFEYLAPRRIVDLTQLGDGRSLDGCVVYYRCGNCFTLDLVPVDEWSSFQMHPLCQATEARFRLEPVVEAQVAALPFRGELYARDPVPIGFYRLEERR
jgi:hypothetical protein